MTAPGSDELVKKMEGLSVDNAPAAPGGEGGGAVAPPAAPSLASAVGSSTNGANQKVVDTSTMTLEQMQAFILTKQREDLMARIKKKQDKEDKALIKDHKFWDSQPMLPKEAFRDGPATTAETPKNQPVNPVEDVSKVRQEPYPMPAGFVWCELDMNNEEHVAELYKLLSENYVEDDDAMFRFDYSAEFLRWALTLPEYRKEWHVGVRVEKTGKLMASITGVPAKVSVRGTKREMVEINFLCVHKKLREKRLAPVLIKEITRRVNLTGRWQAVYTAGTVVPTPIASTQYFHRNLQVEKLIDIQFSYLPRGKRMADHVKDLSIPAAPKHAFRPMGEADVPQVTAMLNSYLSTHCQIYQVFEESEVRHLLLPRDRVIESYVLEGAGGTITDYLSFYYLPSTVMKHAKHKELSAVYSYYNIAGTMTNTELMLDALVLAKKGGADVFNALNVMQNEQVFEPLKFGAGDGYLQYYVYNWHTTPVLRSSEVGIVLV